jgi:hypothetical protein
MEAKMTWSGVLVALILAVPFTLAASPATYAQSPKGDDGTGGAAGYSLPPADAPNASGATDAPPASSDDNASEPKPEPAPAPAPDDNKNGDSDQSPDAPTGADQPD